MDARGGQGAMGRKITIEQAIAAGRTDFVVPLLEAADGLARAVQGSPSCLDWFCYYGDVTALKLVERESGKDAAALGLDVHEQLGACAFYGHWKAVDFLIARGGDVKRRDPETGETPLHSALCKAGRPYFIQTVRLLLDHGADPNAATIPGRETSSFMRDIRTAGETPLHRAAAYGTPEIIALLLERGADPSRTDANGDSPLTWASRHLRPGTVLKQLCFGPHRIGPNAEREIVSDHGCGWGNGMEYKFVGEYLADSLD
jgi:ankyrin repeat protein